MKCYKRLGKPDNTGSLLLKVRSNDNLATFLEAALRLTKMLQLINYLM